VHFDVPLQRALIGFEIDEDHDVSADGRLAAVLVPGTDGLEYLPATS
jgi:hypothetical protein